MADKFRIVKNYDDDELDIVKCDDKQWSGEEWFGKIAGWWPQKQFDTEAEAQTWLDGKMQEESR